VCEWTFLVFWIFEIFAKFKLKFSKHFFLIFDAFRTSFEIVALAPVLFSQFLKNHRIQRPRILPEMILWIKLYETRVVYYSNFSRDGYLSCLLSLNVGRK
jgi:hypothetical protein